MYRKQDIEFHWDGSGRKAYPAVNVKVYRMPWDADTIADHFGCDTETAERAGQFAWDSACENFREGIQELADYYLGPCKVWTEGRSGGWLVVDGLPDVEEWDAIRVSAWGRFAAAVRADIDYRMSWDTIREDIAANEWVKPGSEKYNFIVRDGKAECIADLKAAAVAAGFGPVVKK